MSQASSEFDLQAYGISGPLISRNAPPSQLYAAALRRGNESLLADNGALVAYSGEKTGRSPTEKEVGTAVAF